MKTCEISTAIIEAHEQDGGLWQFRGVANGQPQERHTTTLRMVGGRIEDEDGDGLDIYNPDTEWTRLFAVGKKARRQAERVAAARARDGAAREARAGRDAAVPVLRRSPRPRISATLMALLATVNGSMVTK
jgi:hypothetical protein